ncbi:uncharacterized protein LOC114532779 [Dendronephthya gigantea]|uniref:uncharacterized protein LOC114532779 n=1 Tax=Dendronephthya gigantea TaxID=151771 RepID=UPI00106C4ED4|nr:uncharacterized protein LOC114532779 [Dendronephthya gigantea]
MQNKDDSDESNTADEGRNGQGEDGDVENRYRFKGDDKKPCDQTAVNSSRDDPPCTTSQHDTVLKRFKKKIMRKSGRLSRQQACDMASRQENVNGRPDSFEEDDVFEEHIYEVPFSNSSARNISGEAGDMANGRSESGEQGKNHSRSSQRNYTRYTAPTRNVPEVPGRQNGSVKHYVGSLNGSLEHTNTSSAKSRKERFLQGKSMSLPASRPLAPPPGATTASGSVSVPCDTSSEDSSNEESVQKAPVKKPDLRSLSLPSPSKLNLNYQFLKGLNDLCKRGWYWGPLSSKEAEVKLHGKPDGAFLVRDSNDNRYLLSLSFRSAQTTLHTRIEFCKGKFSFYSAPFISNGSFVSVVELVENCVETSKERVYCYTKGRARNGATFPVRLTKPISRFEYVCTLQHLCRFVIRQHFTLENISEMPLPGIMKRYLRKNHFDAQPNDE